MYLMYVSQFTDSVQWLPCVDPFHLFESESIVVDAWSSELFMDEQGLTKIFRPVQ